MKYITDDGRTVSLLSDIGDGTFAIIDEQGIREFYSGTLTQIDGDGLVADIAKLKSERDELNHNINKLQRTLSGLQTTIESREFKNNLALKKVYDMLNAEKRYILVVVACREYYIIDNKELTVVGAEDLYTKIDFNYISFNCYRDVSRVNTKNGTIINTNIEIDVNNSNGVGNKTHTAKNLSGGDGNDLSFHDTLEDLHDHAYNLVMNKKLSVHKYVCICKAFDLSIHQDILSMIRGSINIRVQSSQQYRETQVISYNEVIDHAKQVLNTTHSLSNPSEILEISKKFDVRL